MSNVINFPKNDDPDGLPKTFEDAQIRLQEVRKDYIANVQEDILEKLVLDFNAFGFTKYKEEDLIYLAETLNAVLYRSANLEHFLHEIIDKTVVIGDLDEVKRRADEAAAEAEKAKNTID